MTATGSGLALPDLLVRDETGRVLALEPVAFGAGGQGRVHRVRDSRLAVKLLTAVPWRREAADDLVARLRAIGRLPLDGLPLARPVAMLAEPDLGFVMELLDGVVALRLLIRAPEDDLAGWYRDTGGLARRLRVLARLAGVLATLHGRGIVYGDPSPGNVLVSEHPDQDQVWLIDPDNLAIETEGSRTVAGTPGYGAPELATGGAGLSTLSDAFAFSVLAFEVLTTLHPFRGDQVYDEEETRLGPEAVRYALPWVDHSTDVSNRLSYGIDRDRTCTATLRQLFRETFEEGLHAPTRRPPLTAWADALTRAADATRGCPGCRHSFFVAEPRCPWCGRPAHPVLVGRYFVHLRAPDFPDPARPPAEPATALLETRDLIVVEPGEPIRVPARQARLAEKVDPQRPVLEATWDGRTDLLLRNLDRRPVHLVTRDGVHRKPLGPGEDLVTTVRPGSPGWLLHLTHRLPAPHRVLTFDVLAWEP